MEGVTSNGITPDPNGPENQAPVHVPSSEPSSAKKSQAETAEKKVPVANTSSDSVTSPPPQTSTHRPTPRIQYRDFSEGVAHLPPYARSLLKIKVPVSVMLAEAKQSINSILSIGPGSILHFSKSCEDTLALEVAGLKIAVGETVKIGDKFGIWITSIILPDERFWVIGRQQQATRAK